MGATFIDGRAMTPDGRKATVNFLEDSGAGHTLLPFDDWQSLGLEPTREEQFRLAEGTVVSRNLSGCHLILPQGEECTPVILGEETDDQALLGALTLEEMGLVLHPFSHTLHTMRLLWRS